MSNMNQEFSPNDAALSNENQIFENKIDLNQPFTLLNEVKEEISKVLVGQEKMVNLLLTALLAQGHVIIEGAPGLAKTLTAKLLAEITQTDFKRIQFTPDLMPSDITGTLIYNFQHSKFEFKKGPVFTNFLLIDEINRAPAKTQAALFEVMEERQITIDGQTYSLTPPFICIATQNPIEHEGTYRLPEAQLDRFLMMITVDYPNIDQEIQIMNMQHKQSLKVALQQVKKVMSNQSILDMQNLVQQITIEASLIKYIAQIVAQTRSNKNLYLGASPRASIALLNASKAFAIIQGRDFVTPEDIQYLAEPILQHRIIMTPEKEMEGTPISAIIQQLIQSIEIPR